MGLPPAIVIADPNRLVGECLSWAASRRATVAALVSTGVDLIAAVKQHKPSVLIADTALPDLTESELLGFMQREAPSTAVIFVSGAVWIGEAQDAVCEGASALVSKSSDARELVKAIDEALAGRRYVAATAKDSRRRSPDACGFHLTARQKQVVRYLLKGHKAKEIAKILDLSTRTVESHKYNIMQILQVHNGQELRGVVLRHADVLR
ncbi:response regulator transcription factor [Dyella sp. C11]|uniref:response regulator transcription factor n=1 Tax=Dyella sp. C11 TaxID=2126991 RepID=UPI000D649B69|nr:response regulator transcription factor [Dyella sp. C11]